jgi:cell wall-associated NlpC family hydrolase
MQLLALIEMLSMEIQQLEQQVQGGGADGGQSDGSNPISGVPSLGGGMPSGGGGGTSGGGGGSIGSTGGASSGGGGGAAGPTTQTGTSAPNSGPINTQQTGSGGPAAVQAMQNFANAQLGKPYEIGGGHGGWGPQSSYDCSGFVSAVLHAGGFMPNGPQATPTLYNQPGLQAGPGKHVTVYDRSQPGQEGHVIMEINNQFYECGGEKGPWGGGGGVEKIGRPTNAYLSTFDKVVHPKGC